MPEGYKCDLCGDFDRHTHKATEIDFGEILDEVGEVKSPGKILFPNCAQELWVSFLRNPGPPEEAVGANHTSIEVSGK